MTQWLLRMNMTKSTFIRLSGWGLVGAAVALLLTFVPVPTAFLGAILSITLGLLGLYARYGEQAGQLGKIALSIGILGGVAGIVASLLLALGAESWRPTMNNAMVVMFLGLLAFGLIIVRVKPMPYGNGLPLLAGFMWPFIVLGANGYHLVTGQWLNVPGWLSFTLFAIMAFFLAWLGYVLQTNTSDSDLHRSWAIK